MNSDTSLFPNRRAIAEHVWESRARSLAYRMLSGAGRAEMLAYRPGPIHGFNALVHGFTAAGELVVAIPGERYVVTGEDVVAGYDGTEEDTSAWAMDGFEDDDAPAFHHAGTPTVRVRFSVEKEAPDAGVQVIAASVHLLGEARWLTDAERDSLIENGGVSERVAEIARVGSLATIRFDVALLHDCCGVTRISAEHILEECEAHIVERECAPICATEDIFASPETEMTAVDLVQQSAFMESGAVLDGLLFGEFPGAFIGRQVVGNPCAHSLGTICLDVDRTGITLMCIEHDQATTVFLPFARSVSTERELSRALAAFDAE